MYENVCDFQIPVDDVFFRQVFEAEEDVFDYGDGLLLGECFHTPEFALKISIIAQLCDNVAVSIAGEYFIAAQNVGMIKFFEDFNFGEEQFFKLFRLERIELDNFDGDGLV